MEKIIPWLLEGDVAIQYQTYRDLLNTDKPSLRNNIKQQGWGAQFLSFRQPNGYWGDGFYMPKWTSTHYTLLDLKNLSITPGSKEINETLNHIFKKEKGFDGGINPAKSINHSDVCVSGMVLNYAAYFHSKETHLKSIVDFLLAEEMKDGGFNCQSNRKGAIHSSLHSTISVLEGIAEYTHNGYTYRLNELKKAQEKAEEFILLHQLLRSDHTGAVIHPNFLNFHYPCRWHYDILRAMDYFQSAKVSYDNRMDEAIKIILGKRTVDGQWKLASKYPGKTYFEMEKAGKASRWNSLRASRVLLHYNIKQ